jgi:hypothetical protein
LSKPEMHRLLHLVVPVKSSSSQRFLMCAKHMIAGWSEVWTVRGMDGGKCCSSSVWSCTIMKKEDAFRQKSATKTSNCRLQFLFQHGAVPNAVDCLSFLLIVFENWSIHFPEQCQHKFSCINDRCSVFFEIFLPIGTLSFHSYIIRHTAESFFCESPSVSLLLTTKILLQNAVPLWCNFLVERS